MVWNRTPRAKLARGLHQDSNKFLIWVGIACVVVILSVLAVIFSPKPNSQQPAESIMTTRKSSIKNENPLPLDSKVTSKKTDEILSNARPEKPGEILNGYIMLPNGHLHLIRGETTNSNSRVKHEWMIFNNPSENVIAACLMTKPGDMLIGTPNYNGMFTQNFLRCLSTPITPAADDPEDIRELKYAVNQAKINLKVAYDNGEDIEQIIYKEREECQNLARYKQLMKSSVYEFVNKKAVTDEDVDAYVTAANALLESKGIAPMDLGPISRIKLKMRSKEDNL